MPFQFVLKVPSQLPKDYTCLQEMHGLKDGNILLYLPNLGQQIFLILAPTCNVSIQNSMSGALHMIYLDISSGSQLLPGTMDMKTLSTLKSAIAIGQLFRWQCSQNGSCHCHQASIALAAGRILIILMLSSMKE